MKKVTISIPDKMYEVILEHNKIDEWNLNKKIPITATIFLLILKALNKEDRMKIFTNLTPEEHKIISKWIKKKEVIS